MENEINREEHILYLAGFGFYLEEFAPWFLRELKIKSMLPNQLGKLSLLQV